MLVDELKIHVKAGDGGDGVVRWERQKFKPKGGPAGGNGGHGGSVFVRAVRDLSLLGRYTGRKEFTAEDGADGRKLSQYGKAGEDTYIDIPVGSRVTNLTNDRVVELNEEGEIKKILKGGEGGLGNEYFKSSTNRAPEQATKGQKGETADFLIELTLVVDVGLIGLPNAGKSTLLNFLTNAKSAVGDYPFTTLEPSLGDFYGYILADIPGLIEGAAKGKGLGHKFLRHISKAKMLLHVVSLDSESPEKDYNTILKELSNFDKTLLDREEWIILSKKDLVSQQIIDASLNNIDKLNKRVFVIAQNDPESIKKLADSLSKRLG